MITRLTFLPLITVGALAAAGLPTPVRLLWAQVAYGPPGSNATVRTDVVPSGVTVLPGAVGAIVGNAPGQPPGRQGGGISPGGAGGIAPLPPGIPVPPGSRAATNAAITGSSPISPSPAVAPTVSALEGPTCTIAVTTGDLPVAAQGGIVEVRVQSKPAGCKPALGSSGNWILLAAGPQQSDLFRFSVSPNVSSAPRNAVVNIGGQKVLIRQAASGGSRFAASPGHVAFSVLSDKAPAPKSITIYSDDKSLAYKAEAAQTWIRVSPAKSNAPGAKRIQIAIDPLRLKPGRNEGSVQISAVGQLSQPVIIPVVVEVPRVR